MARACVSGHKQCLVAAGVGWIQFFANGMGTMAQPSSGQPAAVCIGELEAQYPLYCKALRLLVRDGASLNKVKRTVCWQRLELLHHSLPRQYRDPELLYVHLRREWLDQTAASKIQAGAGLASPLRRFSHVATG